jgi:hypothetical protein
MQQTFFEEHATSLKIAEGRGYRWYSKGDPEGYVHADWEDKRWASRVTNQSPGLYIPRFPVSPGLPRIQAELRPAAAIVTSSHHHYHGEEGRLASGLTIPTTGNHLPRRFYLDPKRMEKHIAKVHGGVNTNEVHLDPNIAKYVFPVGEGAKRVDLHPLAWSRFSKATRVFFVIEGCLKSDAVLSAGAAVISVPSVTLWNTQEIHAVARGLRDKEVYIVPDADWLDPNKPEVMKQAMFLRTFLRRRGVPDTHVAAPPYDLHVKTKGKTKGIDDFLYYGGSMSDLDILEREIPKFGLSGFLAERRIWRQNKVVRGQEVLENLVLHANAEGRIPASLRSVASIMGVHHSRVQRGIKDLIECGAVTVDGDLSAEPRYYDRQSHRWVGWDWEERPTIIIHPELRAKDTVRRLGD